MPEQQVPKSNVEQTVNPGQQPASQERGQFGDRRGGGGRGGERGGQRPGGKQNRPRRHENEDGFDTRIIKVRRVSRMFKGGRRMRLSVFIVSGDRNGRVGLGLGKGADVGQAQAKAVLKAKKSLILASLKGNTIPHEIEIKYKSSKLILKPAAPGTGIIAGSTVKGVLELAGVKDALTKIIGSTNQINAAYATIEALKALRNSRL